MGRASSFVIGSVAIALLIAACGGKVGDATGSADGGSGGDGSSGDASKVKGGGFGEPCIYGLSCDPGLTCVEGTCLMVPAPPPDIDSSIPLPSEDAGTLYERLGEHAGIAALVKDVFEGTGGILSDPQLVSYFAIETPGYAGAGASGPTFATMEACFTDLLAHAAGGPEQYPTVENGFTCRDMMTAHQNLHVSIGAFQMFVEILAAKLAADGLSNQDLQMIGGAVLGTQNEIIDMQRDTAQTNAGIDGGKVYGAECVQIDASSPYAAACTTP